MSKKRDVSSDDKPPAAFRFSQQRKADVDGGLPAGVAETNGANDSEGLVVDAKATARAKAISRDTGEVLDDSWVKSLAPRQRSALKLVLARDGLRAALAEGPAIELRSADDDFRGALFPRATRIDIDPGNAADARATVNDLPGALKALVIFNLLQSLIETRQFLGTCFLKLAVGGMMVVVVPHQFLYERKLKIPSRRVASHRRFYTSNTLLADLEEAIDPCEFRIRYLCENDTGYNYRLKLSEAPDGGQDIILVLQKIARPLWSAELDQEELWTQPRKMPLRFVELKPDEPSPITRVVPDPHEVRKIILLKLDHRGDFLMAGEAFKIFRNAFPTAEMTLVCGSWNIAEAEKSGWFDKIVPLDFFPEDDSARSKLSPRESLLDDFASKIDHETYDLAVDLRLFEDTREVLRKIDARVHAGFDRYDAFPWLAIRLNTPSATEDDRAEQRVITASSFYTSLGGHRSFEIRLDQARQPQSNAAVIWGPYEDLRPGRYLIECLIEPLAKEFDVACDIIGDPGGQVLYKGTIPVRAHRYPSVQLHVGDTVRNFEFRIRGAANAEMCPFRFMGLRLVHLGVTRGVHQSEAMALLAHLVRMRTVNSYTVESLDAAR